VRRARAGAIATLIAVVVGGCATAASPTPLPTAAGPTPAATVAPTASPTPSPTPSPVPTVSPTPSPTPSPVAETGSTGRPTRVAMPSLDIDLPIIVPRRNSTYPLCDVAEFFRPPAFQHPGAGGVTYIYAHAQEGMFLPILQASQRRNGRSMLGATVTVWSSGNHRYTYEVVEVRRRQKSLAWAFDLPPDSLVLQTSETPYRNGTKTMLVARQIGEPVVVGRSEARPRPEPRRCG
jgi:hypothetical protein